MEIVLRLLFLIELVHFGDQFLQEHLYSPKSLAYLAAAGAVMLLGVLLAETGGSPLLIS